MVFYSFYINDFRAATANWPLAMRWFYFDLLNIYYDSEQPLTLNLEALFCELGAVTDEQKEQVKNILKMKFERTENGYINARCAKQIANYQLSNAKARENGSKGGKKTQAKKRAKINSYKQPSSDPLATLERASSEPKANQYSVISNQYSVNNKIKTVLESAGVNNLSEPQATLKRPLSDPLSVFAKFQMFDDWQPDRETLNALCRLANITPESITTEIHNDFVVYWSSEQKVFTQRQWIQKLISFSKIARISHGHENPKGVISAEDRKKLIDELISENPNLVSDGAE